MMRGLFFFMFSLVLLNGAGAADVPMQFDDVGKQQRFETLLEEIRCLVCQNQSLADSSASLAGDLRREIHRMVSENQADEAVLQFLVDRYGDFVLYRPRWQSNTWLLWSGPFALLLVAVTVTLVIIKRQAADLAPATASDETGLVSQNDVQDE